MLYNKHTKWQKTLQMPQLLKNMYLMQDTENSIKGFTYEMSDQEA